MASVTPGAAERNYLSQPYSHLGVGEMDSGRSKLRSVRVIAKVCELEQSVRGARVSSCT